ncbi:hypothetical protein DH2020_014209 [Rehmannia glutinosa]|uniref:F-box associated beta-propeller type 1 domain-containing protein n=1 Tax=Rehmannia glutinosa TaxID=99300 RepID=A0ABR0WZ42_REHGL
MEEMWTKMRSKMEKMRAHMHMMMDELRRQGQSPPIDPPGGASRPTICQIPSHKSEKDSNFRHERRIMLNYIGKLKQCSVRSLFYEPIIDAFDTDYSARIGDNKVAVVGSCDGLICLTINGKDSVLWNPSTRISKKLPDFDVEPEFGSYLNCGLGFDKSSDDYKVVGFYKNCLRPFEVIVKVYSLKTDQWRNIKTFMNRLMTDDPAIYANGKLHWIAYFESKWRIFFLDLETEEYGKLQLPNFEKRYFETRLGASEGCLYILSDHLTSADLWIIDDYGIGKDSWTKVVSIPDIDGCFLRYTYKSALCVLKNGKVLFQIDSKFVILDTTDGTLQYPEIGGRFYTATTYVESLVSLVG